MDVTLCGLLCSTWQGQIILLGVTFMTIWQEYRYQKITKPVLKKVKVK